MASRPDASDDCWRRVAARAKRVPRLNRAKHASVRELVDNGARNLSAMADTDPSLLRCVGPKQWEPAT